MNFKSQEGTMARLDEQKPVNDENVEPVSDEPRKGVALGLSGSGCAKDTRSVCRIRSGINYPAARKRACR
jgi:hypothetical protein